MHAQFLNIHYLANEHLKEIFSREVLAFVSLIFSCATMFSKSLAKGKSVMYLNQSCSASN